MITKKLHDLVFGWSPVAFEGKGYWFVVGKNGSLARAATSKEANILGHPKEKFHRYQEADRIKSFSLSDLIADKILNDEKVLKSTFKSVGEKVVSNLTSVERFFDPVNVVRKMTGGSRFATATTAKVFGRSMLDAKFFLGEKPEELEKGFKVSGSISEILKNIYKTISKEFIEDKKRKRTTLDDMEELSRLKDKRNKELIDALLGKGKFKHKEVSTKLEKKGEIPLLGKLLIGAGILEKVVDDEIGPLLEKLDIKNLKFSELEKLIDEIAKVLKAKAEITVDKIEGKTVSKELEKESHFAKPTATEPKQIPKPPQETQMAPKVESGKSVSTKETAKPSAALPKVTIKEGAAERMVDRKSIPTATKETESAAEKSSFEPVKKGFKIPSLSGSDKSIMALIEKHEGIRYEPYKDTEGYWTIGVGHLIGKNLPADMNRTFSKEEVEQMFAQDYSKHKAAAEKIPNFDKLNSNGKAALIDITFNMGPGWWKRWPTFTRNMKEDNIVGAMKSLKDSKWYKQVGNRAQEDIALLSTSSQTKENVVRVASKSINNATMKEQIGSTPVIVNNNTYAINNTHKNNALISTQSDASHIQNKARA